MYAPLELSGLTKTFMTAGGPVTAVQDVNAHVQDGEFVCLLGHSGCGKSTVLSMIAGLERATLGGVIIEGAEIDGPGPERAVVFQAPSLLPWLTARQNVRLAVDRAAPATLRLGQTYWGPSHHLTQDRNRAHRLSKQLVAGLVVGGLVEPVGVGAVVVELVGARMAEQEPVGADRAAEAREAAVPSLLRAPPQTEHPQGR